MQATRVTRAATTRRSTQPTPQTDVTVVRTLLARVLEAVLVVLTMASVVFFAMRLLPGDPARLVLGDEADEASLAPLRHKLGLDAPLYVQYARFLKGLFTLDLGESLRHPGETAASRVAEALGPTAELAIVAVALGATFGIVAAMLAVGPWLGTRKAWIDRAATALAATPLLSFAPLLTFALAARARIVPLPGDPDAGFGGTLFASALLAIPLGAQVARVSRAALDEVARAQFLTVARAKGATSLRTWVVHALPASMGPIVTVIASQLGALLGGAVVLERLFERPGLGSLILEAYSARDLPVLEAAIVAAGAFFVVAQILAALVHAAIDPRVRR
jgi:peptide/nickel transport system permease protein